MYAVLAQLVEHTFETRGVTGSIPVGRTMAKYIPPSDKAVKTAKEVVKQWHDIQAAGAKVTREMTGGDPWGPSLGDFRDGEEKVIDLLAALIDKHMKA